MPTNSKKGDKVKVIRVTSNTGMNEDDLKRIYEVERKFTRRWSGRQFVDIRLNHREDLTEWNKHITVPIQDVIKVNTKMYELRNKLIGGSNGN